MVNGLEKLISNSAAMNNQKSAATTVKGFDQLIENLLGNVSDKMSNLDSSLLNMDLSEQELQKIKSILVERLKKQPTEFGVDAFNPEVLFSFLKSLPTEVNFSKNIQEVSVDKLNDINDLTIKDVNTLVKNVKNLPEDLKNVLSNILKEMDGPRLNFNISIGTPSTVATSLDNPEVKSTIPSREFFLNKVNIKSEVVETVKNNIPNPSMEEKQKSEFVSQVLSNKVKMAENEITNIPPITKSLLTQLFNFKNELANLDNTYDNSGLGKKNNEQFQDIKSDENIVNSGLPFYQLSNNFIDAGATKDSIKVRPELIVEKVLEKMDSIQNNQSINLTIDQLSFSISKTDNGIVIQLKGLKGLEGTQEIQKDLQRHFESKDIKAKVLIEDNVNNNLFNQSEAFQKGKSDRQLLWDILQNQQNKRSVKS